MMIISNNLSGLWGLFSGPIIGVPVTLILQNKNQWNDSNSNGLKDNITNDLILQSKIFNGNIIQYEGQDLSPYENNEIIIIGENFTPLKGNYSIESSNFIEETSELSRIIGKIYNENPNNPPLSSVPHSTTTISSRL